MRMFRFVAFLIVMAAVIALLPSCKKDKKTNWGTELLVPIATSKLTLQNLVKDSSITAQSDGSLILAYNSTLYEFNLADQIINIPDTSIGQKFTLTDLLLPNQGYVYRVSLGTLAQNMLNSPDGTTQFLGQFLIAQNGNSIPIPPLSGFAPGRYDFDASAFFDSAVLSTGIAMIWAVNRLPVPVTNITCELRNSDDNTLIEQLYVPYIEANDSVYLEIQLAGKKIKNVLAFEVTSMSTPGSNGQSVLVDTTNYIELRMFVTNLRASEAWAKFPTQNVIDLTEEVTQEIGDRKFTYVDARQGQLHVYVTSSVEEQLYLEYTLEGAYDKFGKPVKEFTTVPPAPPGGTVTVDRIIDISGTSINLTGKDGSKFNTYTQRVVARLDSSGIVRHITSQDSLIVRYEILNVRPNYIKGYAGRDTIATIDSASYTFLDLFKSGSIDLEDVNMKFVVENGIGVDGQVKINGLTAYSANNGSKTLTGSILGQPLTINRATDFPLTRAVNTFTINNTNSNIRELIGILPNRLNYDVEVKTNVNGNNQQYRDFAYLESGLKVGLNAEIPLSFIANQLVLQDTIDFDLSQTNTNVQGITDGIINIIVQNKYPLDATLKLVIVDENWNPLDTLLNNQLVASADLNNNCRAEQSKRTKVPLFVDQDRMDNVKLGKKAIIKAVFNSPSTPICAGQYLRIYSDYFLDITFTAKFNYEVNADF
jgi:hypothetical protein